MMEKRSDRERLYRKLLTDVQALLSEERDPVVWMASLACLIHHQLGFFWVGFYRAVEGELVIGPYQGTVGCLRISFDRGVCGACATAGETIIVPDVHEFPGHIACDSRSQSEIVVPVFDAEGELRAVLDIDSTTVGEFDGLDQTYLEQIVSLMKGLRWTQAT